VQGLSEAIERVAVIAGIGMLIALLCGIAGAGASAGWHMVELALQVLR